MDLAAELAQFKPEPALAEWVGKLLEKTQNDALRIQQADLKIQQAALKTQHDALKIQALTFELAYYKRIRFANKSEQFTSEQRELFEESWTTDTSALEAEVEQSGSATPKPKRERAGRQPLPEHLPRIEHRHEPESCTCGQCGLDLVKIGEESGVVGALAPYESGLPLAGASANSSMSNPPASSSIATSVRSTPAVPARPSPRRRSRPPSSTAAWPHRDCSPG